MLTKRALEICLSEVLASVGIEATGPSTGSSACLPVAPSFLPRAVGETGGKVHVHNVVHCLFTPPRPLVLLRLPALGTFEYTPFLFDPHRCAKIEHAPARFVLRLARRPDRGRPARLGGAPRPPRQTRSWRACPPGEAYETWFPRLAPPEPARLGELGCHCGPTPIPVFQFLISSFPLPLHSRLLTFRPSTLRLSCPLDP